MIYWVWGAWGLQRLIELGFSRRNAGWLRAQGAHFVKRDGFALIVAVHVLALSIPLVEHARWPASFGPWTIAGAALFIAGQALRIATIAKLGRRWNTRVAFLPPRQTGGILRLRHPNYLGVFLEVAGLPLAFGLWRSAVALTLLNAVALARRIRIEERAMPPPCSGSTGRP